MSLLGSLFGSAIGSAVKNYNSRSGGLSGLAALANSNKTSSPSYGQDSSGYYKTATDGNKVYQTDANKQYFPTNYGGGANWEYTAPSSTPSGGSSPTGGFGSSLLTGLAALAKTMSQNVVNAQYQPLPYPEKPNMELQYPNVDYMSYDQAQRQAQGQLDPQYNISRNNMLNSFQQEKKRLPQILNARGQLHGGLMEGGEVELNQRQNMALESLNLENQSALANLAQALQSQDQQKAQSIADRQFASQQANAQMAMDKWRADVDNVWKQNDARQSALARLAEYQQKQQDAAAAAEQDAAQREFDMWKYLTPSGSDLLQQQQFETKWPWEQKKIEYDLNKPYYSPNTGGSDNTASISQNTSDFIANMGSNPVTAALYIQKNLPSTGGLVDTGKVFAQFQARFGEDAMKYLQGAQWTNQEE